MAITETEEKLFENDTTMTLSLLAEAVRASMPGAVTALCGLIAAAALIRAAADRVICSDGAGSPGRPGFRAAALITVGAVLLFLFVLYPYLRGAVRKTKRLLLLSMKNGTHIVMRQDSFHGCVTDDFFAFLKTALPEKGFES